MRLLHSLALSAALLLVTPLADAQQRSISWGFGNNTLGTVVDGTPGDANPIRNVVSSFFTFTSPAGCTMSGTVNGGFIAGLGTYFVQLTGCTITNQGFASINERFWMTYSFADAPLRAVVYAGATLNGRYQNGNPAGGGPRVQRADIAMECHINGGPGDAVALGRPYTGPGPVPFWDMNVVRTAWPEATWIRGEVPFSLGWLGDTIVLPNSAEASVSRAPYAPLDTTFTNNNYGAVDGAVFFDLLVGQDGATITDLDCNLQSPANTLGTIQMYVLPGQSHAGHEHSSDGWIDAGRGAIVAGGPGQRSNVVFNRPVSLIPGRYGVALHHQGVAAAYTNGTGGNQTYSTNELTLTAGSAQNALFGPTVFTPRVWNGSIHYVLGGFESFASVRKSGSGCGAGGIVSFYEDFPAATFDLASTTVALVPNGYGGYLVQSGSRGFVSPASTGLALTDDSLSSPIPLPFAFPYAGGSTSQIRICSNGFVYLNGTGTSTSYTPTAADLLTGGPRLCPIWMDLLPDGSNNVNNVYVDSYSTQGLVIITWLNVPEYGVPGSANTIQLVLHSSGFVECSWFNCAVMGSAHHGLVGFSPGIGSRDPGNRDISATMPFFTESDGPALTQDATRPLTGLPAALTVSGIPAGSLAGVELIGVPIPGGIDMGSVGMPGCMLYVNPIMTVPFTTAGNSASVRITIPATPGLDGVELGLQALTLSPGANAASMLTSNLATLVIGQR